MFSIKLPAHTLAAVAIAQSNEETRYYLCGVCFDGPLAVATNSHILTAAEGVDREPGDETQRIMPVSKKAIAAAKKPKAQTAEFADGILKIYDDRGEILHMEPCAEIDGTFPEWRHVVPQATENHARVCLSSINMKKICETAETLGEKPQGVFITGDSESSPQIVRYDATDQVITVVMPVRGNIPGAGVSVAPSWVHNAPETETADQAAE